MKMQRIMQKHFAKIMNFFTPDHASDARIIHYT